MAVHHLSEFERFHRRRHRRERQRRMLNNLPLAHRLASDRATDPVQGEQLLGEAMVGLVRAADCFDQSAEDGHFRAFARPHITSALDRGCEPREIRAAQAEIADALESQERVRELAGFFEVPVNALVGALMDAAQDPSQPQPQPLSGVA